MNATGATVEMFAIYVSVAPGARETRTGPARYTRDVAEDVAREANARAFREGSAAVFVARYAGVALV